MDSDRSRLLRWGTTATSRRARVVRIPTVVVFPAPFGPSSPSPSPRRTAKLTPSTAFVLALRYRLTRSRTSTTGPCPFPSTPTSIDPASAGEDHLAGDLAGVQVGDQGEGVGQGGGGLDLDREGAGGGLVGQGGHVLDGLGGGHAGEDPEPEDGETLGVEGLDPEGGLGVGRVAVDDHAAVAGGGVQQGGEHG